MTERTAREVVMQSINDFDDIRDAIRGHRVAVPYPTKTSLYAELIANIRIGSLSGTHKRSERFRLAATVFGEKNNIYESVCLPIGLLSGQAEIFNANNAEV